MKGLKNQVDYAGVRISFAAQAKPVPSAGFVNFNNNYVKTAPIMSQYRKPRLVKGSRGWYIEYYYQVPLEVREDYDNKKWKRWRVVEDMNRRKGSEREVYAEWLLGEISTMLRNGFSPFGSDVEFAKEQAAGIQLPTVMDADKALTLFIETWEKRGIDPLSLIKYKKYINRLSAWLKINKMHHADIKTITTAHIEKFLDESMVEFDYGNREYNNSLDFIRTCFNFLVKKKFIDESPCADIDKKRTKTSKHRFYDTKTLNDITKALLAKDPYTYLAAQTVYYLCIRSDKELMNFRVGGIQWDQNKIFLEADATKGNSARYVPMDDNIKALFLKHEVDKYPPHYYVFGIKGTPSAKPFAKQFFSKRFRKVREASGINEMHTIYSMKHTRIIHLKQDGLSDADIMSLTGHKDFVSYAKYLRDLGLDADPKKINKVSRKI